MKTRGFRLRPRGSRFFTPKDGPIGFAEFAGRLADGWLWLDGWFTSPAEGPIRLSIELEGREHEIDAQRFSFSREDLSEFPAAGQILVLPLDTGDAPSIDAIHLALNDSWYTWTGSRQIPIRPDLAFRLPEKVEAFSPEIEQSFRRFWFETCPTDKLEDDGSDPIFELNAATIERMIPAPEEAEEEDLEEEEEEDEEEEALEEEEEEDEEEEPPAYNAGDDQPLGISLEQVVVIDDHHVFLRGWWWDAEGVVEGVDLISPPRVPEPDEQEADDLEVGNHRELTGQETDAQETDAQETDDRISVSEPEPPDDSAPRRSQALESGNDLKELSGLGISDRDPDFRQRDQILKNLVQVPRPDVSELYRPNYGDRADDARGFFGLVRVTEPSERHRGYRLELRPAVGESLVVGNRPPIHEPFAGREVVLRSLPKDQAPNLTLLRDHMVPALEPLQAQCRQKTTITARFAFGEAPATTETSLLVPLFRRLDLIEHQMAHLAADPDLGDYELIYVLDSPELAAVLEQTLFHLSRLFGVAARGLVLERNVGFAGAINAAAAEALGRRLVLLHSDVFPDRSGWIRAMAELADSNPRIGAVGPALLYEDRALQHAGLYFSRERTADRLWAAVPYFKGLPERFFRATVTRRVPALSGACLMIDRDLFERAGGLQDVYVAGDLEDADLCLRCRELGYESWYLATASLYHLEGLSQLPGRGWQRNPWTKLYNRYLFDRRWSEQIPDVLEECGDPTLC